MWFFTANSEADENIRTSVNRNLNRTEEEESTKNDPGRIANTDGTKTDVISIIYIHEYSNIICICGDIY